MKLLKVATTEAKMYEFLVGLADTMDAESPPVTNPIDHIATCLTVLTDTLFEILDRDDVLSIASFIINESTARLFPTEIAKPAIIISDSTARPFPAEPAEPTEPETIH